MKYRILIVEDSKLINDSLKKELDKDGHEIKQAYDFQTGLELIQSETFDYVLLDLILPDGEGEMLLPYCKRLEIRVIVMTTDRDTFRRDRMFGFGIVDYIIKDRYFDDTLDNIRNIFKQVESNSKFTLLVVDDSNFIRNNLEMLLTSRGFLVLTASNGKDAYQTLERYPVDALVADLEMPEMDGFALMTKIRRNKNHKNLPVIILTGSNDSNLIAKVIKYEVKDLIKKPYVIEEVLLKIDNMMNQMAQKYQIEAAEKQFDVYHDAIVKSTLYMKISPRLEISYSNERLSLLIYGKSFSHEMLQPLQNLMKNPSLDFFRSLHKLAPERPSLEHHFIFENYNGEKIHVLGHISAIFDLYGNLKEFLFLGEDVTQMYLNEEHLKNEVEKQSSINLNQQRVMFNQAKMAAMGEMIGNIAHQWRQPLTVLSLLIQDAEDAFIYGDLNANYVKNMSTEAMRQIDFMSHTIEDFRNFFRPDKAKTNFNLTDAVIKAIEIIKSTLQSSHIQIFYENLDSDTSVFGYHNEFQQVIINLCNNSRDAILEYRMKKGENFAGEIHFSVKKIDQNVYLTIGDNGGGISENILERIFEPYYTTKDESKGTGVGLYMSKTMIEENMSGKLLVSNSHDGAVFTIILPEFQQ